MENKLINILYIDDEKAALFNFKQLFQDDFEVYTALSAAKAMEILEATDIQIIVSDQRMPDKTGIEFFAEVAQLYPDTLRILLTAYSEAADIIDAINRGQVYQYITKPFETLNVKNILDKATQHWRLKKENELLIAQLQNKNEKYEAINEKLRQTNEELSISNKNAEESKNQTKEILQTAMDGFWIVDLNGKFIDVNDVACKMLGYTRKEILDLSIFDLEIVETAEQIQKHLQKVLQIGEGRFETKHRCKNGQIINVELSVKFQSAQNLIVVFVRDITYHKQAEEDLVKSKVGLQEALEVSNRARQSLLSVLEDQRLAEREIQKLNAELEQRVIQRTTQLEAVNKELETFTYSVSHDLKAPLRGIDGYSKLLLDIHSKNLNDEAKAFLSNIRSSTLQMNNLIEDLLEYSRLERSTIRNEKVKLIELIDSITSFFKNDLSNENFVLKLDIPNVELMTDEKGLTIILRNILANAIKFTKEKPNPSIEIGFTDKPSSWLIYVKDNGIGFDMKYHGRIFEIFQRLHRAEDYAGTGIGLAMVSKGMQRLNGKVWAESILGEGSTFYLEIPKLAAL